MRPVSDVFGFDRGTPVDRYYLERWLERHREDLRGVVGEIAEDHYTRRFGGPSVEQVEIIDLHAGNPRATLVADLGIPGSLPTARFDALLVVQTLQYVAEPDLALGNCLQALRPGGVLLVAVPALVPHDERMPAGLDRWRYWPAGLAAAVRRAAPDAAVEVTGYGNLVAATAALHGIAAEELRTRELADADARFPVLVCARIRVAAA
ncbi:hypothetical protein GCM10011354_14070 [Egicoccus halophilus]|uniref:Methyltransferase type 11 domain-containing protein n=2 Tax=Egicoccus halophilus TaxID=1670830 RepID=A0A8J3EU96_9ACTN|nr:hypothetical protein GCM10011354_14070 [Egicoccus halophilus]